jgi:hypothetical protein
VHSTCTYTDIYSCCSLHIAFQRGVRANEVYLPTYPPNSDDVDRDALLHLRRKKKSDGKVLIPSGVLHVTDLDHQAQR